MVTTTTQELLAVFGRETSKPERINPNTALFQPHPKPLLHKGQTATETEFNKHT